MWYIFLHVPSVNIAVSVALLIITVPICGAFTRWRAHYEPKVAHLDSEKVRDVEEKNKVSNVFQMMGKVYRLEGTGGLYKGFVAEVIHTVLSILVAPFVLNPDYYGHVPTPPSGYQESESLVRIAVLTIGRYLEIVALSLVFLPVSVLYIRSITTPYRLSWFNPIRSLRILLTPEEFSRPWTIYTTPGLTLITILNSFVCKEVGRKLYVLHLLEWNAMSPMLHIPLIILHLMLIFAAFPALNVIRTKLSVRREGIDVSPPQVDPPAREYSAVDVVGFRQEPYTSLADCAKKIVREEGVKTLFRLWWLNVFGVFPIIYAIRSWVL